ncbi:hypothetical protein ASC77_25215 [Nocardioides sp. Root1257]|nr:hypothetical protein ASC77_25215 [Nocardioides sp. Root1257]KRC53756.1 hypothetical protein ASE24_25005 [Nocardioides sp. Root224]
MRILLAAAAVSVLVLGAVGGPAHAATPLPTDLAGTVITWGDESNTESSAAIPVPGDLTGLVRSVAASAVATGAVTVDGQVKVWGDPDAPEVSEAPAGITDATTIVLSTGNGAVLHADGRITAWGSSPQISAIPSDLRAKAIALTGGTGYAVRPDGTLTTWGATPAYSTPAELTDLVDVSVSVDRALALHANGTVTIWGFDDYAGPLSVPDFGGKKVIKVASGTGYSAVVLDDGSLKTWGNMPPGEPPLDGQSAATKVVAISTSATERTAGAVSADGNMYVWGGNNAMTGVFLSGGKSVAAVALGENHAAAIVTAFRALTQPTVTGTPEVGQTLTATPATLSLTPDAPATGQWYAGNDPIAGKTATTLIVDDTLVGKTISYRTTATRGADTVASSSTQTGAVAPVPTVDPVPLPTSTVSVSVSPARAAVGTARAVTATVTTAGTLAPTGTVTFTVGTTTATTPLTAGRATWQLPSLKVGAYRVSATYSGDANTAASTSTVSTLTVTKATSKVTGKAKVTGKTRKVAKKVTLTLTVKSTKGLSAAGTVSVKLTGASKMTVTTSVNAAGKATVTYKNLKRGKYTVKLTYTGNQSMARSTGSLKFKA